MTTPSNGERILGEGKGDFQAKKDFKESGAFYFTNLQVRGEGEGGRKEEGNAEWRRNQLEGG